jgi:hypothetical protein
MYGLIKDVPHIRSVEYVGSLALLAASVAAAAYLAGSFFFGW